MKTLMTVKVIDNTSLLNNGVFPVLEEFADGYFIACHGDNGREFVLKIHTEITTQK